MEPVIPNADHVAGRQVVTKPVALLHQRPQFSGIRVESKRRSGAAFTNSRIARNGWSCGTGFSGLASLNSVPVSPSVPHIACHRCLETVAENQMDVGSGNAFLRSLSGGFVTNQNEQARQTCQTRSGQHTKLGRGLRVTMTVSCLSTAPPRR